MNPQNQRSKYYHQLETWTISSGNDRSRVNTRDPNPMARWQNEKDAHQPWNAIAFFKTDTSWREFVAPRRTSSIQAENGSVYGAKWEIFRRREIWPGFGVCFDFSLMRGGWRSSFRIREYGPPSYCEIKLICTHLPSCPFPKQWSVSKSEGG